MVYITNSNPIRPSPFWPSGCVQISGLPVPSLGDFELIASLAFSSASKDSASTISSEEFLAYITSNPTSASWVSAYDDLDADEDMVEADPAQEQEQEEGQEAAKSTAGWLDKHFEAETTPSPSTNYAPPAPSPALPLAESSPPVPPSAAVVSVSKPNSQLSLEWIHGYNGSSCRNNVGYSSRGFLVYPAATVGVLHRAPCEESGEGAELVEARPSKSQLFFNFHSGPILSQAISPCGTRVATGSTTGEVFVWSAVDGSLLGIPLGNFLRSSKVGVGHLAFSGGDGNLLACSGNDTDHTVVVMDVTGAKAVGKAGGKAVGKAGAGAAKWSASSVEILHTAKTSKTPIFGLAFNSCGTSPTLATVGPGNKATGTKPITFHVRASSRSSSSSSSSSKVSPKGSPLWSAKKGIFGPSTAPVGLTCVTPLGAPALEALATGTASGGIIIWSSRNLSLAVPSVHSGRASGLAAPHVASLSYSASSSVLVSGGSDGTVKLLHVDPSLRTLTVTASLDVRATGSAFLSRNPSVASAVLSPDGTRVAVGTRGNEVFELSAISATPEDNGEETVGKELPFPQVGDLMGGGAVTVGHGTGGEW